MKTSKTLGYILTPIGIILLILSAVNYIVGFKHGLPPATFGIIFTAIGVMLIRKSNEKTEDK